MINGAVGAAGIGFHLRNDSNPQDFDTIYGRLLYRAHLAQIATTARAIFWYQGESDGDNVAGYTTSFDLLYNAWHEDYPALERVYLFQIRKGCGVTGPGVREFHRTAPDIYPDLEVMSTTAAPGHDGCHFYNVGYRELGDRVIAGDARSAWHKVEVISAPNIERAELTGASDDQVLLTFRDLDDTLFWDSGSEYFFYFDDATTVISGSVAGNTILLQLSGTSTATTVSYNGHETDGSWIYNGRGIGALTFFDFPIDP